MKMLPSGRSRGSTSRPHMCSSRVWGLHVSMLLIVLVASSMVKCEAHTAASSSAPLEIHRRRECKMERLWESDLAHVNATTEALFDAQQSSGDGSPIWTRSDSCSHRNETTSTKVDCFSAANVAITDSTLTLNASTSSGSSASVTMAIASASEAPETAGNAAHRLRIHAHFPTSSSVSNATVSLSLSASVSASLTLESRANDSHVVRLQVLSPTRNVSVELTPPCPLGPTATKIHVVDIEWEASDASVQWIRWHWDGHLLHDVGVVLPAVDASLTVGLSLVSTASSAADVSILRVKRLEIQRMASDQDASVCRPRVIHADANCRPNHQHFEPRLGDDQGYLSLQQVYDFVHAVPSRFPPELSSVQEIGVSTENRSLLALCIGLCDTTGNSSNVVVPQVLFTGMHHSREPISMMNLVYTIDLLALDFANGDVAMTALLLSRQLWFVLVVNPDGYARNEALETWANRRSGQRKNGRTDGGCEKKADVGVDLNRNYDVCFSHDQVGSSTDPCGEDFRGPAPFSEPETLAIKQLVERAGSHFTVSLNYHSFGRYFNVPFACESMGTPKDKDLEVYEDWAKEMTRFNGFQHGQPWKDSNLYSVNGETSDWLWAEHGIFSMSPEVGPSFSTPVDEGFWPAKEDVPALSVELHYSNLVAAELSGPNYQVVVTNMTREPAADDGEELSALLHVQLALENRGLRVAGDVEIVLTTALEDGGAIDKFTTTARVNASTLGTVRSTTLTENGATVVRSLVIPEAGSMHLLVRDALSCQYIRLTTFAVASDASSVAFQQWQPVALPLCGICRSLGRDEKELKALGPAPLWCQSVEDLVQPDALSVAVLRSETAQQTDQEPDAGDEERDAKSESPTTTLPPTLTPVTVVPTATPEPPATTEETPTLAPWTTPPLPTTTAPTSSPSPTRTPPPNPTTAEPVESNVVKTSSSSSFTSMTSFVSVPILATVVFVMLIVFAVVLRRRRRLSREAGSSHAAGSSQPKVGSKRKTYVQVMNEDDDDDEDDGLHAAQSPRSRARRGGGSDDEDAEYGRRRSPASP